jgi:hypothetical protein
MRLLLEGESPHVQGEGRQLRRVHRRLQRRSAQSIDDPLGVGGPSLMNWFFPTRTFQQMHGGGGGETGIDDDFAVRGFANVGATQRRRLPPAVTCASAAARPRSASTCRPG